MLNQVLVATSTKSFNAPTLFPKKPWVNGNPIRGITLGTHLLLEFGRQLTQSNWRTKEMVFSDTSSQVFLGEDSESLNEMAHRSIKNGTTRSFSNFLFDSGIVLRSIEMSTPQRTTVTLRRAGRIESPRDAVVDLNNILNDALGRAWREISGPQ